MSWAAIIVTFALLDNAVLARLLGTLREPWSPGTIAQGIWLAGGVGVLVAFSSVGAWAADAVLLDPIGFGFLRIPVSLFLVASLGWLFQRLARLLPAARKQEAVFFPEAALNSAGLGLVLLIRRAGLTGAEALGAGLAAGVGYALVTVILTTIRQRLDVERVPPAMRGLPLHLVSAGLLAYAFLAFDRAFLSRVLGG